MKVLSALYIAQKRIVELINKTTDEAEITLLLRDKMTIDEAVKTERNSMKKYTQVKISH